jgi:hypothetical protein
MAPRATKSRRNQIGEDAASFIGASENFDDLGDDARRALALGAAEDDRLEVRVQRLEGDH